MFFFLYNFQTEMPHMIKSDRNRKLSCEVMAEISLPLARSKSSKGDDNDIFLSLYQVPLLLSLSQVKKIYFAKGYFKETLVDVHKLNEKCNKKVNPLPQSSTNLLPNVFIL